MGVSLILLRRARTGIALSRCGWVCVYAPMWPGTSFLGYPFLDLRPEKWVGGVDCAKAVRARLPALVADITAAVTALRAVDVT